MFLHFEIYFHRLYIWSYLYHQLIFVSFLFCLAGDKKGEKGSKPPRGEEPLQRKIGADGVDLLSLNPVRTTHYRSTPRYTYILIDNYPKINWSKFFAIYFEIRTTTLYCSVI